MKRYKWAIILLNLVLLLVFFNVSLTRKEKIIAAGDLILLKLAPVDPRSLMQGDYMRLNYEISNGRMFEYSGDDMPRRGYCVVKLDENGIAKGLRIQPEKTPLAAGEHLIRYNAGSWGNISIGAEAYFFQEGEAGKYEKALYGGIRVDKSGNSVLIGLYDKDRALIR